jgi:hypothetical protein
MSDHRRAAQDYHRRKRRALDRIRERRAAQPGAPSTTPPPLGVPTGTCPLCRRRPADCWAACACEPGKRFAVCGPCLDTMGRSGRGWYYWAWRAGLVSRDEVDELDDDEDDPAADE